jgi:hypothetical protein
MVVAFFSTSTRGKEEKIIGEISKDFTSASYSNPDIQLLEAQYLREIPTY